MILTPWIFDSKHLERPQPLGCRWAGGRGRGPATFSLPLPGLLLRTSWQAPRAQQSPTHFSAIKDTPKEGASDSAKATPLPGGKVEQNSAPLTSLAAFLTDSPFLFLLFQYNAAY